MSLTQLCSNTWDKAWLEMQRWFREVYTHEYQNTVIHIGSLQCFAPSVQILWNGPLHKKTDQVWLKPASLGCDCLSQTYIALCLKHDLFRERRVQVKTPERKKMVVILEPPGSPGG